MESWQEWVNLACLVFISAPVAVLLAQAIRQPGWPNWAKVVTVYAVATVGALAQSWLAGDVLNIAQSWGHLTAQEFLLYATGIFTAATFWYKAVLEKAGVMLRLDVWPKKN